MSTNIVPGPASVDREIPSMSMEYGINCEIGGEFSQGGVLGGFGWSKSSWSPCELSLEGCDLLPPCCDLV